MRHKVGRRLMSFNTLKAGPEKSARRRRGARIAAAQQKRLEKQRESEREQERRRDAPDSAFDVYGDGTSSSSDDDYQQDPTYLSNYYANRPSTPEASCPGK